MKKPAAIILFALLIVFGALREPALAVGYSDDQIHAFYDYDRSVPLEPQEELIKEGTYQDIYKVTFNTTTLDRVSGQLYMPKPIEPGEKVPVIVYLHGYADDRTELDGLSLYLMGYHDREIKYAVLALDAMYRGDREERGRDIVTLNPRETRYAIVGTIIDYRRAVDYLYLREDIDLDEIHLLGTSMGAYMGSIVGSVEERIRAVGLLVGGGDWCKMVRLSLHGEMIQWRQALSGHCATLDRFWNLMDPVEIIHMLSPRPLQMHNGLLDLVVPTGGDLYDAALEPKEIYWYLAGHTTMLIYVRKVRNRTLDFFDAN